MADQLVWMKEPEAAAAVVVVAVVVEATEVPLMAIVGIPLCNYNNLYRMLMINSATDKKANVHSRNNDPTLSLQYHLLDSEQSFNGKIPAHNESTGIPNELWTTWV